MTVENDVRDEAFLILTGKVKDITDGQIFGPGQLVGVYVFLSGYKRITTCICEEDCCIMTMTRNGLQKAMEKCPQVTIKLIWKLSVDLSKKFVDLAHDYKNL